MKQYSQYYTVYNASISVLQSTCSLVLEALSCFSVSSPVIYSDHRHQAGGRMPAEV